MRRWPEARGPPVQKNGAGSSLLQIEKILLQLLFTIAEGLGQVLDYMAGQDGVLVKHVSCKITGKAVQVHRRRYGNVFQESRRDLGVTLELLRL